MADDKNVGRRQLFAAKVRSLMLRLLVVWFVVSFGFGILLVEPLNEIRVGGYKLGFWFDIHKLPPVQHTLSFTYNPA